MSNAPDLKTVKSVLRGLLVSTPSQQRTVTELNNDYKREEGIGIPFREFGFTSNLDFLRSISDTVHVIDNYGQVLLKPVVNSSTAHVSSLVRRQSNPKKRAPRSFHPQRVPSPYRPSSYGNQGNWSPGRLPSGGGGSSYYTPPPRLQPLLPNLDSSEGRYGPSHGGDEFVDHAYRRQATSPVAKATTAQTPTKPNIFFPLNLQQKIIQFVNEQPGISFGELDAKANKDYQFTNLNKVYKMEDLVSFMSDSLRVSGGNKVFVLDTKLKDLPSVSNNRVAANYSTRQNIMPAGYEDYDDLMQDLHYDEDGFSPEPMPPTVPVARGRAKKSSSGSSGNQSIVNGNSCAPKHYSNAQAYPDEDESRPAYRKDNQGAAYQNEKQDTTYLEEEQFTGDGDFQASAISEHVKRRITKLLESNPSGIWCSQLPNKYQEAYNSKLSFYDLGYVSIVQMLVSVPELFALVHIDNADWKVLDARTHPEVPTVTDAVRANVGELLAPMKYGIRIDDVQAAYEHKFGEEIKVTEMGFGRLEDLFASLDGGVVCMVADADGRPRVYRQGKQPDTPIPHKKDDPSIRQYFKPHVVGPDFVPPPLILPPTVVPSSNIEVLVAAIFRPDNFYIQLRQAGYGMGIDVLMDDMYQFYTKEMETYRMPPAAMVPGIYICCFTENEYHRGLVMSVNQDDTLVVKLVDYGNCRRIQHSVVYFLHKDFAVQPAQAVACRCANLWPPQGRTTFTRAAGVRLLELVLDKALIATVAQVDHKRVCMSVCLVDTNGADDIHINDVLEREGHAVFRIDQVDMVNDVAVAAAVALPSGTRALSLMDRLRLQKELAALEQDVSLTDGLKVQKQSASGNRNLSLMERLKLQKQYESGGQDVSLMDWLKVQKQSASENQNLSLMDSLTVQKESASGKRNLSLMERLKLQKESTSGEQDVSLMDRLKVQKESASGNRNLSLMERLKLQKEAEAEKPNWSLMERLKMQKGSVAETPSISPVEKLILPTESPIEGNRNLLLSEQLKLQAKKDDVTPISDRSVAFGGCRNVSVSDPRGVARDPASLCGTWQSEPERAMYNGHKVVFPSQRLSAHEKLSLLKERLAKQP